jgi:hypothetical protein
MRGRLSEASDADDFEATLSRALNVRHGYPGELLFHVADSLNRSELEADGATAGFARLGPDVNGSDFVAGHLRHVYLWPTLEQARRYAAWAYGWGGPMQIWEIDAAALPLQEDPYFVDDAEACERWRLPSDHEGETLSWRTAAIEPARLLEVVDTIDGDEDDYAVEELYGDNPDDWPCECGSTHPASVCSVCAA